ncbi:MAG: radical SAM protein [Nitrospinota bacterium]
MNAKTETSIPKKSGRKPQKIKKGARETAVCLIYPNSPEVGFSNLGFHKIYSAFSEAGGGAGSGTSVFDIAFLPERGQRAVSYNKKVLLGSFGILAFSITFEIDIFNVLEILKRCNVPLEKEKRKENHPLVCAGGVAATLNPEPFADIFDFFVIGEGEGNLEDWLKPLLESKKTRDEKLKAIAGIDGIYVPSFYDFSFEADGKVKSITPGTGAPEKVKRLYSRQISKDGSCQSIISGTGVFGDTFLILTGKGCGQGCRFCAAGFVYRPVRHINADILKKQIDEGLAMGRRIGLIGSAISEHPQADELFEYVVSRGGRLGVSSLRIGKATKKTFGLLAKGGLKTLTIAPETGTQRLRTAINKNVTDDEILETVGTAAEAGILNIKLYFLIGLPGETDEDVSAISGLIKKIHKAFIEKSKKHGRLGKLTVGINPFVPKPQTPFQWSRFADVKDLKRKSRLIRKRLAGLGNLALKIESPKNAAVQALLSLGSRQVGKAIVQAYKDGNYKSVLKAPGAAFYYEREKEFLEILPWDFIDSGVTKEYLWKEHLRSRKGKVTPPCPPTKSGCKKCGVFEGVCF